MSILIKGISMPTRCWDCPIRIAVDIDVGIAYGCELLKAMISNPTERLPDCPLVELPPHGRLIDADTFNVIAYQGIPDGRENTFDDGVEWLANRIDTAPTIIEAEADE